MSFTDQKPQIATEKNCRTQWGGGFWCKLCGHKFQVGDTFRWIYANDSGGNGSGNFLVCQCCDGEGVLQRGRESYDLAAKLAKQWGICGHDWQRDAQRYG